MDGNIRPSLGHGSVVLLVGYRVSRSDLPDGWHVIGQVHFGYLEKKKGRGEIELSLPPFPLAGIE